MLAEYNVRNEHQRVKSFEGFPTQRDGQVGWVINIYGLNGKAELTAGVQDGREALCATTDLGGHCPEADSLRNDLSHQLDPFDSGLLRKNGNSGHVSTRTRETMSQSGGDRIYGGKGDNGDDLGCFERGKRGGCAYRNDGVDRAFLHNPFSECRKLIHVARRISKLEMNVFSFDIAQVAELITDPISLRRNADWREMDYMRGCLRLLSPRGERPSPRSSSKKRNELAPSHFSAQHGDRRFRRPRTMTSTFKP